ncbi:PAS domain S-box protein [Solitalea koreensis]|uniref:PAS domain S-box protein n=1 Tax=Solitalea koreensis TaxID=543615 RepID=UPI00115C0E2B|nr:PAS domain S-box protein [Solitalea koreensis]
MLNKFNRLSATYKLPRQFIWTTLIICILPSVLNLLGVDFGFKNEILDISQLNDLTYESQQNLIYEALAGRFVHVMLVGMAIAIAFLTVILAFVDYSIKRDITTPIVGVALFCAGLFDVFHILTATRLINITNDNVDISAFTWLLSSGYHALILIIGTGMFLVQRPGKNQSDQLGHTSFITSISLIFILLTLLTINVLMNLPTLPESILTGPFYTHPYDGVPLILYFIAGVFVFPKFYEKYPSIFSQTLVLSLFPAIFTQLHMAFSAGVMFDNNFMIAHFMKLITYGIPFVGLCLNYLETLRNEKDAVQTLNEQYRERQKAEKLITGVLNSSSYVILAFESIRNEEGQIVDFKTLLSNPSANNMLRKLYRYSFADDLKGHTITELFPYVKKNGLYEEYVKVVESDKKVQDEYYSEHLNRWFYINAVRYLDGFVLVFDDITEIKRNAIELEESKNFIEKIANNTPTGILVIDVPTLKPLYINKQLPAIVGYSIDEMSQFTMNTMLDIVKGEDIGNFDAFVANMRNLKEGSVLENEYRFKHKNGSLRWLYSRQVAFRSDEFGNATQVLSVLQDVTERKIDQDKLLKSERKFRSLFEQSKDVIFIINRDGDVLDINESAVTLLGTDMKELRLSVLPEFFLNENEWKEFLKQISQRGSVTDFEVTLINAQRERIYVLITASAQYDAEGRTMFYQGIIHDITELKRNVQERIMSQKLDATGRVARTIAHEVRNPLTNVNLALEQLKQEISIEDNEDYNFYFDIIQRNCTRINVLITQLLNSTRAEYLQLERLSVNELLDASLELAIDRIKLNEIVVIKEYTSDDCYVAADAEKIKIALLNIIINAIEAMPPQKGVLTLRTLCKNAKAIIEIEDNGSGISEENIGKLFEPFYSDKENGTGLGLTSTQNIILNHNGNVDVESEEGLGTKFTVTFSLSPVE